MLVDIAGEDDLYMDIGDDPVEELLAVSGDDYALVGDDYALVGARRPPARRAVARRRISPQQALAMSKAHAVVSQRGPTAARNAVLGFGPTAIAAGGTATVTSAPQLPFRGERLGIPSDTASSFRLTSLIVGQANQLPNGNSIPGRAFDERADGMEIVMDTAQGNSPISLGIVNTSLATQTFEAWIRGTMVR